MLRYPLAPGVQTLSVHLIVELFVFFYDSCFLFIESIVRDCLVLQGCFYHVGLHPLLLTHGIKFLVGVLLRIDVSIRMVIDGLQLPSACRIHPLNLGPHIILIFLNLDFGVNLLSFRVWLLQIHYLGV